MYIVYTISDVSRGCFVCCNDTATTEIYTYGHTLSLHDALPIYVGIAGTTTEFTRNAASGGRVHSYFCPTCGSTVFWKSTNLPGYIGVAVGAIADPGCPAPVRSVFEQSRHAWVAIGGAAVEHFQQGSVSRQSNLDATRRHMGFLSGSNCRSRCPQGPPVAPTGR